MIRCLLRRLFPSRATGGEITDSRPRSGEHLVVLSLSRRVDDPYEAEVLGLTADARRLRRHEGQR